MSGKKSKSEKAKATRAACWARGEDRKKARRDAQHESMRRNIALRKEGKPTPWQSARIERGLSRARTRELQPGGQS
jgi:hypothetical protein